MDITIQRLSCCIKVKDSCSNILASSIKYVTGINNITKVWYDHYYKLLNSNVNTSNQLYVESIMSDIVHSQSVFSQFSALDVKHAINKHKTNCMCFIPNSLNGYFCTYSLP